MSARHTRPASGLLREAATRAFRYAHNVDLHDGRFESCETLTCTQARAALALAAPAPALDVERLARALYDDYSPDGGATLRPPPWTPGSTQESFYRIAAYAKATRIDRAYAAIAAEYAKEET